MVYTTQGPRERLEDRAVVLSDRLIICDGMGGHVDGDRAAQVVLALAVDADQSVVREGAAHAVSLVGRRSGTTCSVAHLDGHHIRWLHAGDSALWLVLKRASDKASGVFRLTADHSLWGIQRERGNYTDHDNKHILMSCVTGNPSTEIEWQEGSVDLREDHREQAAAIWLFGTSDGFHEAFDDERGDVSEDRLLDAFRQVVRSPESAQRVVEECAQKTGDNATVAAWRIK